MTAGADVRATFPIFPALDPHYPPASNFDRFIDARSHKSIFDCAATHLDGIYCPLKHEYDRTPVDVVVGTSDVPDLGPEYDVIAQIPLAQLYGRITHRDELTIYETRQWHTSLPLYGSPDAFPQDSYRLDLGLALGPEGVIAKNSRLLQKSISSFAPGCTHDPRAYDGSDTNEVYRLFPGSADKSLTFSCTVSPITKDFAYVYGVSFTRDRSTAFYVYTIACILILFFLVSFHIMFFNNRYRDRPMQDFLPALLAAMLAILPLRFVLIPPDIPGMTRADIILGAGAVLFATLGMLRYAIDAKKPITDVSDTSLLRLDVAEASRAIVAAIERNQPNAVPSNSGPANRLEQPPKPASHRGLLWRPRRRS